MRPSPAATPAAHPLAAAYRPSVLPLVAGLLADDCRRMDDLLGRLRVTWLDVAGDDLRNLNDPADYAAARALPPPEVSVDRGGGVVRSARAATLGEALGSGAPLVAVAVNGEPVAWDPEHPLVAGDVVTLGGVSPG